MLILYITENQFFLFLNNYDNLIYVKTNGSTGLSLIYGYDKESVDITSGVTFACQELRFGKKIYYHEYISGEGNPTFKENINNEVYVEYARVHGNLYGTPKDAIDSFLADDFIVIMEIDWQGALNILKAYPKAESVFISPPSIEDLRQRLLDRGLDSEDVINQRVSGAEKEI